VDNVVAIVTYLGRRGAKEPAEQKPHKANVDDRRRHRAARRVLVESRGRDAERAEKSIRRGHQTVGNDIQVQRPEQQTFRR